MYCIASYQHIRCEAAFVLHFFNFFSLILPSDPASNTLKNVHFCLCVCSPWLHIQTHRERCGIPLNQTFPAGLADLCRKPE